MAYMSQEKKATLAPAVKAILKEYGLKGSLSVHHHSSLVLTIKSGKIDFLSQVNMGAYLQVNTYHIERDFNGEAKEVLVKLKAAMDVGNHDRSDIQSDYFDVGWWVEIGIGKWDSPYILMTGE
jgi:hypothetical protein